MRRCRESRVPQRMPLGRRPPSATAPPRRTVRRSPGTIARAARVASIRRMHDGWRGAHATRLRQRRLQFYGKVIVVRRADGERAAILASDEAVPGSGDAPRPAGIAWRERRFGNDAGDVPLMSCHAVDQRTRCDRGNRRSSRRRDGDRGLFGACGHLVFQCKPRGLAQPIRRHRRQVDDGQPHRRRGQHDLQRGIGRPSPRRVVAGAGHAAVRAVPHPRIGAIAVGRGGEKHTEHRRSVRDGGGAIAIRSFARRRAATPNLRDRSARVPAPRCRPDARGPTRGRSGSSPCTSNRDRSATPLAAIVRESRRCSANGCCARLASSVASAAGSTPSIDAASSSAGAVLTLSGVASGNAVTKRVIAASTVGFIPRTAASSSMRTAGILAASPGCAIRPYHESSAPPGSSMLSLSTQSTIAARVAGGMRSALNRRSNRCRSDTV